MSISIFEGTMVKCNWQEIQRAGEEMLQLRVEDIAGRIMNFVDKEKAESFVGKRILEKRKG